MFCEVCGRRTQAISAMRSRVVDIRGEKIEVEYQAKLCALCGEELYVDEVELEIMNRAKEIYRRKVKLISPDELKAYMEKHNVSPEDLAAKVGCAVNDIIFAAHNGLIQKSISNQLKKVISA